MDRGGVGKRFIGSGGILSGAGSKFDSWWWSNNRWSRTWRDRIGVIEEKENLAGYKPVRSWN